MTRKAWGSGRAAGDMDASREAQRLLAAGDTREAVRVLANAQRYREAAHLLKHTGHIDAAAHYYVKGKAFDLAEGCFLTLGDRLNAARCAAAAGQPARAATVFEELGDRRAAAEAHARAGNWLQAGRLFHVERRFDEATVAFSEWLRRAGVDERQDVTDEDLGRAVESLAVSPVAMDLVRFVLSRGKLAALTIALLEQGRLGVAVEVYEQQRLRIDGSFLTWAMQGPEFSERALLFAEHVADQSLKGELLDRLGRPAEAAQAYLAAGDYDKAYECSLKTEDWSQIERLKAMISARGETMPGVEVKALVAKGIGDGLRSSMMSRPRAFSLASDDDSDPGVAVAVETPAPKAGAVEQTKMVQPPAAAALKDAELSVLLPSFMESKLCSGLGLDERRALWDLGTVVAAAGGDVVVDAGSIPIGTYTLLSGAVEVHRLSGDGYRVVDRIVPGQNFGETWLLIGRHSQVRIVAAEDSRLHVVERTRLEQGQLSPTSDGGRLMQRLAATLLSHLLVSYGSEGALALSTEGAA